MAVVCQSRHEINAAGLRSCFQPEASTPDGTGAAEDGSVVNQSRTAGAEIQRLRCAQIRLLRSDELARRQKRRRRRSLSSKSDIFIAPGKLDTCRTAKRI